MKTIFFYIFLFLVGVMGIADTSKQMFDFLRLKQQIKNLASQPLPKTVNITPKGRPAFLSKEKMREAFFSAVQRGGLHIQSIAIFQNGNSMIDATLIGNFMQIQTLLHEMSQQCFPFVIKKFVIEKYARQLKLELNMDFLKMCLDPARQMSFFASDPFAVNVINPEEMDSAWQNYSIKQLKLLGFLQYPKQKIAIVSLLNGGAREIAVGTFLGREQARLLDVRDQKMFFETNGKIIEI